MRTLNAQLGFSVVFLTAVLMASPSFASYRMSGDRMDRLNQPLRIPDGAHADATVQVITGFLISTRQSPRSYAATEAESIVKSAKKAGLDPIAFSVYLRYKSHEAKTLGYSNQSYPISSVIYQELADQFGARGGNNVSSDATARFTKLTRSRFSDSGSGSFSRTGSQSTQFENAMKAKSDIGRSRIQGNIDFSIWALANEMKLKLAVAPQNGAFASYSPQSSQKVSANLANIPSARLNLSKSGASVRDLENLLAASAPYVAGAEQRTKSWASKWIVALHVEAASLSR